MNYPTAFRWTGSVMEPSHPRLAASRYVPQETYLLAIHEDRSRASHDHEFAWLHDAWLSLPEGAAQQFPTETHLRRHALIRSGWCNVREYVCASRAEAERWRPIIAAHDEYAVVTIDGLVIRELTAKSQSKRAMNKADWQASKTAVMDYVAGLLGVSPSTLPNQRAA